MSPMLKNPCNLLTVNRRWWLREQLCSKGNIAGQPWDSSSTWASAPSPENGGNFASYIRSPHGLERTSEVLSGALVQCGLSRNASS